MKGFRFSDFVFGLTSFLATDGFCDEFVAPCAEEKIIIFNMKRTGNEISGEVHQTDIKKLTEAAEKSGMSLEIKRRYGLPHIYYRYRKRFGIPAGLAVFILITAVLHSVIWSIDISPTEIIPKESIEAVLSDAGIKCGIFSAGISVKDAEMLLYEKFDDISWVNVRIVGTRLNVDISEVRFSEHQKETQYSNIVAAKDGEVTEAGIFRGEGKIHPGTAVVKGDLLISGIVNHRDGTVKFVDSEGRILARTKTFFRSIVPSNLTVKKLRKCKDIYLPVFFGIAMSDMVSVKDNCFTESEYFIDGGDVTVPVGAVRRFIYSPEECSIELSEDEARLICFRDFAFICLEHFRKAEILESNIEYSFSGGAEFSGSFISIEDIALKKTFTVEETEPSR